MGNIIFRSIAVLCLLIRWWYWRKEEKVADTKIPKNPRSAWSWLHQTVWLVVYYIPVIQICGIKLFVFSSTIVQLFGVIVVVVGTGICLWARTILAENWANGYEHQVKKRQQLVMKSIYRVIRHPIYLGLAVILIGLELVAQSYLWIAYCAIFIAFYFQGRREEKILLAHFGKEYKDYMKRTKMLIPYLL